jgi:hypothetical protein
MPTSRTRFSTLSAVLGMSVLLLSACGGGSSSGADTNGPITPPVSQPPVSPPIAPPVSPVSPPATPITSPLITSNPQPQLVLAGQSATFSVTATGASALSYQWSRNGVDVPGATSASYIHPPVLPGDSGTVMRVKVTAAGVTVTPPPVLLHVGGRGALPVAGTLAYAGPVSDLPGSPVLPGSPLFGTDFPYRDGLGQEARFNVISDLAVDGAGNVYAADFRNRNIRQIAPDGMVRTAAGSGESGQQDGYFGTATFVNPKYIGATRAGTVYVLDEPLSSSSTLFSIRKIPSAGPVSTLTIPREADNLNADGSASPEKIMSFTVDPADNLYIVSRSVLKGKCFPDQAATPPPCMEPFERVIVRRQTPDGAISTVLSSERAYAALSRFDSRFRLSPYLHIAVDKAGTLYASSHNQIFTVSASGTINHLAGSFDLADTMPKDGVGLDARFGYIRKLAISPAGKLHTLEGNGTDVIRAVSAGGVVTTLVGNGQTGDTILGALPGRLFWVRGLAFDANGTLYTATAGSLLKIVLD